jgi:hypothetical protein
MIAQVAYVAQLAASGTASVVITPPQSFRHLSIRLSGSGTSTGVTGVLATSPDGTTYTNSLFRNLFINPSVPTTNPAAAEDELVYATADSPFRKDANGNPKTIRVNLTNNDGAHPAQVVVCYEVEVERGR